MTGDQIESLFAEAVDLDPAQRDALLSERCGDNLDLRREIEALLDHASRSGESFLSTSPVLADTFAIEDEEALAEGQTVGERYTLVRQVGAGGMGAVYLARQTEPLQRDVALKVVRPGIGTSGMLARFEQERRTLARLNHPNIATVHDAGLTPTRQPFFVMEWAGEQTLLEYIRARDLDIPARLSLFLDVCAAVQYAHQHGVIHRDLKPSNLLVSDAAGRPVVKVIDFGIAKLVSEAWDDTMTLTVGHQPIGTPLYMSPEQAAGSADIDTRSDVYALGAILYELLTGTPPFGRDNAGDQRTTLPELLRMIREDDPVRPSRRAPDRAAVLRGELDWITFKALEKDPDRRYPTAAALADDIVRYQRREPVEAGPPGAAYRIRAFCRRNTTLVLGAVSVFAVLITATVVISLLLVRAVAAEQDASTLLEETVEAKREVDAALQREQAERREAERQQRIAQHITDFLTDDLLAQADPERQPDRELSLRDVLDRASDRIAGRFDDEPLVEAQIRSTLGRTYRSLGLYEPADAHLQRAVELRREHKGEADEQTLVAMIEVAYLRGLQDRLQESEQLYLEVLALQRMHLGDHHPHTLTTMNNLAATYINQARFDEAEALTREVLELRRQTLGEEDPRTATTLNNLGAIYNRTGRYDDAERTFLEALRIRTELLGEEDPETQQTINNLAVLYGRTGRLEQATEMTMRLIDIRTRMYGESHRHTAFAMINLGSIYNTLQRWEDAEPVLQRALAATRDALGDRHHQTGLALQALAFSLQGQARYDEAVARFEEAISIYHELQLDQTSRNGTALRGLGECLMELDRPDEAERRLLQSHELLIAILEPTHPYVIQTARSIVDLYETLGRESDAAAWRARTDETPADTDDPS